MDGHLPRVASCCRRRFRRRTFRLVQKFGLDMFLMLNESRQPAPVERKQSCLVSAVRRGCVQVSRMKSCVISALFVVLVCLGGACSHTRSEHGSAGVPATIVVQRPENNGSVNILRCTVIFSSGQSIGLSGGEAATLSVPAGSVWMEASSFDLYHPENADPRAWRSGRVRVCLGPGEVVRLSVEPKSKGSTYVGGWTIERAANERS